MLGDIILPKEEVDMIPTTGDTRLNLVCLIDAPEQLVKFVVFVGIHRLTNQVPTRFIAENGGCAVKHQREMYFASTYA